MSAMDNPHQNTSAQTAPVNTISSGGNPQEEIPDHQGDPEFDQDEQLYDIGSYGLGSSGDEVREQDRFLPIANISRIMKKSLPNNAKIAKEAKETVQECVSEFISFITSEASDRCIQEKRKTINGEDLLWAMGNLGFDSYIEPLRVYLQKYREHMKGDKSTKRTRRDTPPGGNK